MATIIYPGTGSSVPLSPAVETAAASWGISGPVNDEGFNGRVGSNGFSASYGDGSTDATVFVPSAALPGTYEIGIDNPHPPSGHFMVPEDPPTEPPGPGTNCGS